MATLITYTNSQGKTRCTSRCYLGHGEKCSCGGCHGINHGAGYNKAMKNTKALAAMAKDIGKLKFHIQEELFEKK